VLPLDPLIENNGPRRGCIEWHELLWSPYRARYRQTKRNVAQVLANMTTAKVPASLGEIFDVPLKDIEISEDNVRESRPDTDLDELAASIKLHGLLQPVVLKGIYGKPQYELIGGQRRYLAHQRLGRAKIRAVFAGSNLSKTDVIIRSLVENLQRVELEYADTAKAVTYLYKKSGNNDRKVADETGLSLRRVRDFIQIEARATPKMKFLLRSKKVSVSDVKRAIRAAQDNLKKAEELVELIAEIKPTSHQKTRLVNLGKENSSASAKKIFAEAMKPAIEQNLVITLPDELMKALREATKALKLDPEELAAQVLSEWLESQGFS
jgi:ParB/RepB/Spo0J family partition protein